MEYVKPPYVEGGTVQMIRWLGFGRHNQGTEIRFQTAARLFYPPHCVQTVYETRLISYPVDTKRGFPWGKVAEARIWHSTSSECQG